jgi:hypothetical protein
MRQKQNAKYQNMILLAQLFDHGSVQVRPQYERMVDSAGALEATVCPDMMDRLRFRLDRPRGVE